MRELSTILWSGSGFVAATYCSTEARDRALRTVSKEQFELDGKLLTLTVRPFGDKTEDDAPSVWSIDYPHRPQDADTPGLIRSIIQLARQNCQPGTELPDFDVRLVINRSGIYVHRSHPCLVCYPPLPQVVIPPN